MKLVLLVIGFVILAVVNAGSIIYFLYLWGGLGVAVGTAAWSVVKIWMLWFSIGIVSIIASLFIKG